MTVDRDSNGLLLSTCHRGQAVSAVENLTVTIVQQIDLAARRWLITGGCGFIGRSLIATLLDRGVPPGQLRVLDNLSVGTRADLQQIVGIRENRSSGWDASENTAQLIVGDIRDEIVVAGAHESADVVVHLAACTGVQPSVDDPFLDCNTNVNGTLNCLNAARNCGVGRFVFASSGAPLGNVTPPIHENLVARPISPYGASKLAGEAYCSAYFHCFGLETAVLRFGNVYGPLSSKKNSVVAKFIRHALANEPLEIYGDGSATRDYIFTDDLVRAVLAAATMSGIGGEVFQIATNRETTVQEVVDCLVVVLAEFGYRDVNVVHREARKGDMPRNYSDTSKARSRLGWQAHVELMEGLRRTVQWYIGKDIPKAATS